MADPALVSRRARCSARCHCVALVSPTHVALAHVNDAEPVESLLALMLVAVGARPCETRRVRVRVGVEVGVRVGVRVRVWVWAWVRVRVVRCSSQWLGLGL